jgi:hypothetical protein
MDGAATFFGRVNEDGNFSVLARVCALEGSGAQVAPEEGYCLTQADVSSIVCKVFDLGSDRDNAAGTPVTPDPAVTVSASVYDALQTNGWPTTQDQAGYNFRFDVSPAYAPAANEWYLLEFKFTLSGGGIAWLRVKVKTVPVQSS